MNEIRIPLDQYAYINVKFEGTPEETLKEYRRLIALSKTPVESENTPNLQPIPFMRLLYKRLCNEGLEMEEVEGLGTDKMYSQKDVHKIIESLISKSKREANGGRINKEEDIRYN